MSRTRQSLVGAIVTAVVLFATGATAVAETCTLTLKRRETKPSVFDPTSYTYWSVRPQYVYMQMHADGNGSWQATNIGNPSQADAFKRIVKKEPKYQSENPFRGVVKLGSQEYAFALDVAPPKAKQPDAKQSTAKAKTEPGGATTTEKPSANEKPVTKPALLKDFSYNRLYFDFNRNGDLTDDKVVEAAADSNRFAPIVSAAMSYLRFEFPRIDVTIDVEGTKLDYSFYLDGYANASYQEASGKVLSANCSVMVSINSAICREGDITLEGKRHHIVLLDFNSNGRFDDQSKVSANIHLASGQLYPETGDMLLIDPKVGAVGYESPYDPTGSDFRCYVSDMIMIDGQWYDLKISPAGDKLTLTRSTAPMGSVTNKNEAFRALIYGSGKGFLKICGTKDKPIPVPEGQWKLLSYTITQAKPVAKAEKTAETKPADKAAEAKHGSLLGGLGQLAEAITGGGGNMPFAGPSLVSATATEKYKPVTVRKGETVELPFGPPYTPTVTSMSYGMPNAQVEQLYLEMNLLGVCGEQCTNMIVKGGRPGKPDFTITDPDGKVVQQGSFEYG